MNSTSLLPLPPLEPAASRAESPQAAALPLFPPDPGAGRRDSRLRGLESNPAWLHTPLGAAAVGAGQTYIHSRECPWGAVATPGWDSLMQCGGPCPGSWDGCRCGFLGNLLPLSGPVSLSVKWSDSNCYSACPHEAFMEMRRWNERAEEHCRVPCNCE